jgi:GTP-binding protein
MLPPVLPTLDDEIANILRKGKKPVFVVVNKLDNNANLADATEFYSLGLGEIYTMSSMTGSGTGELLG